MKYCALGKLRLPSAPIRPPQWSIWAWLMTTASTPAGSMPACFSVAISLPVPVPNRASRSHSGIEQDDAIAKVHDKNVLFQHSVVGWQEVILQFPRDFGLVDIEERGVGITERELSVGDDGAFGGAELEAVEIGGLWLAHRHFRMCQPGQCQRPGTGCGSGQQLAAGASFIKTTTEFLLMLFLARRDR